MTNDDGDYVPRTQEEVQKEVEAKLELEKQELNKAGTKSDQTGEVFFRARSTANSPKSAKYTKINKNKNKKDVSPAASVDISPNLSDNKGACSSTSSDSTPAAESILTITPPAGEALLGKLYLIYTKELESGIPGVTKVCQYQGLQGLAASYHLLPQPLRDICKLPDHSRTRLQQNALAAYGFQVLLGKV